jgi:VHL beta domain
MLDANLTTAIWGAVSVYGFLAGLLISRADQNYQTYKSEGSFLAYKRAMTWAVVTASLPVLGFVTVLGMSLVGILEKNGVPFSWPPSTGLWVIICGIATTLIFVAIVLVLITWPPRSYNLLARGCSGIPARSSESATKTHINFVNELSRPVRIIWIDYSGVEQDYGSISPDTREPMQTTDSRPVNMLGMSTYEGCVWEIREQGARITHFVVQDSSDAMVITESSSPVDIPARSSGDGTQAKVHVSFVNELSRPVRLFWIDYQGNEQDYGLIGEAADPGEGSRPANTSERNTYAGCVWVVREVGACITHFVALKDPHGALITE